MLYYLYLHFVTANKFLSLSPGKMIRQLPYGLIYRECGQAFEKEWLINPFGSVNGTNMGFAACWAWRKWTTSEPRAIAQRDKIDLLSIFTKAGVKPSWDATYTKDAIENAVKGHIGTAVYVSCRAMNKTHFKLFEIYICLDVPGTNYVVCPPSREGRNCGRPGTKIIFPPKWSVAW